MEREPQVQEGSPLGFVEFGFDGSAIRPCNGSFDYADPRVKAQLRGGFLGRYINLTRRVFNGEVEGWVRPIIGGLAGVAFIVGLVVIEKKYRHDEDLKNILEKVGITKEDVLGNRA